MAVTDPGTAESVHAGRVQSTSLRAFTGVAMLSALGMMLGYARDAGLAAVFGASTLTDAFFVATIVPMIAMTVVMSGALAPALLPVFTATLRNRRAAWDLANAVLTVAIVVLLLLSLTQWITAPLIVRWLAPGFDPPATLLATQLTRLSTPLLGLMGVSALLGALANALGSFRVPALSTAFVNGGAFALTVLLGARFGIQIAVVGLVLGALVQLVAQVVALRRTGWRYAPSWAWPNPMVAQVLRLFVPLAGFVALAQVVPVVERIVASGFPAGDLSLLTYAGKVFLTPGVILSSSLAIVLYPQFAARHASGEHDHLRAALASGIRAIVFLTLPLALWFAVNAEPLVRLIFERGQFSAHDTVKTARLLEVYALAIVPAGVVLILTRALHAQRRMLLTLGVGVVSFGVYVTAAVSCTRLGGLFGLPLALCLSQLVAGALLGGLIFGRGLIRCVVHRDTLRLAIAVSVSAALLAGAAKASASFVPEASMLGLALALGVSLVLLGVVYVTLAAWLGFTEAEVYLSRIRARWQSADSRGLR